MVLGVVEYAHDPEQSGVPQWCRIRPVFRSVDGRWLAVEAPVAEFPTRGLVYWYGPAATAEKGTFWIGDTYLNQGAGEGNRPDKFGFESASRPYELVYLRGYADRTDLRRRCAKGDFSFSQLPIGPILLKLPGTDSQWVGPLELVYKRSSSGRYIGSHEGVSGFLPVHDIKEESIQELTIDGNLVRTLRPQRTIGGTVGWFNAQDDESLLQSALRRIRKVDRPTANALGVTKAVFDSYVETLRSADLVGDLAEKEAAREHALTLLIERIDADFLARQDLASSLLAQESVQKQLRAEIATAVEERRQEIEAEAKKISDPLLQHVSKMEERLSSLRGELADKEEKISSRNGILDAQQVKADTLARDLELRLRAIVKNVASDPIGELGKQAVFQALVAANSQSGLSKGVRTLSHDTEARELSSLEDFCGALIAGANAMSIEQHPLMSIASSLLAGRSPVCIGDNAFACSRFVGSLIANRNVFEVALPSNVYGANDLLRQVAIRCDDGLAVTMQDLLESVASTDGPLTVIFTGINRAPLEAAFENVIHDGREFGSRELSGNVQAEFQQTYRDIALSRRIFVIGTLTEGPSTFRMPHSFRRRVSIVTTERLLPAAEDASAQIPTGYRVAAAAWKQWQQTIEATSLGSLNVTLPMAARRHSYSGYEMELKCYRAVFGDNNADRAVVEWMAARLAGVADQAELLEVAELLGEGATTLLKEVIQAGVFDVVTRLLD